MNHYEEIKKQKIEESKKTLVLASDMSKKYYNAPLIITYSGGKDSDVLLHLAQECLDVSDYEVLNSHTTVDAPETVYHIRKVFSELNKKGVKTTIDYHKKEDGTTVTMWNLIPKKQMPPTRLARYCCSVLKETSTPHRLCAVGVRASESTNRSNRDIFCIRGKTLKDALYYSLEHADEVHRESQEIQDDNWDCTLISTMKKNKDTIVNPIYHWTDTDVWEYIRENGIETNPLYARGYLRVGCIGCPLAPYHQRIKEFKDYPKLKDAYIRAFDQMVKNRNLAGKETNFSWKNGQEVFDWWIEEYKYNVKGQYDLFSENQ